jgi:hypothetical protein
VAGFAGAMALGPSSVGWAHGASGRADAEHALVQDGRVASRCRGDSARVVIGGRARCLRVGQPCRGRLNVSYHRYAFHCAYGSLRFWWTGLLRRPLKVPTLAPGSPCPATAAGGTLGQRGNRDAPEVPAFGPGPAYPTLASASAGAELVYSPAGGLDGWGGTKMLWTVPRYYGPIVVRGRQLDGPNELRFDRGPTWTNRLHHELRLVGPYRELNPAATYLLSSGCYAYQVDGRGFSYLIVFNARAEP